MQIFPSTEAEILPQIPILFVVDRNEKVIRAVLESPAGHEHENGRRRKVAQPSPRALAKLTTGMSPTEKRQVVAIFLAIYSGPSGPSPETAAGCRRGAPSRQPSGPMRRSSKLFETNKQPVTTGRRK